MFGVGPPALLELGGIAVVGSREPEPLSESYAVEVGRWAASAGVQVVSGAARGVDSIAMTTCAMNGGTALGVVAESMVRLSTRREFRDVIITERVCLISSYDPETAFSPAIAMGRNRWVHALADRAVVVACSEGRGGTWAGAVEALKRWVRVFVRVGNPDRPGNDALLNYGAVAAPQNLDGLLHDEVEAPAVEGPAQEATSSNDLVFGAVSPIIVEFLRTPATAKEIAGSLLITPGQLKIWLARLCETGQLVRVGSRYRATETKAAAFGSDVQMQLLDR